MNTKTRDKLLEEIDILTSKADLLFNEVHDAIYTSIDGYVDSQIMIITENLERSMKNLSINIDSMQTNIVDENTQETYIEFNAKTNINGQEAIPRYTLESSLRNENKGEITNTYIDFVSAEDRNEILLRMKTDDPELFELISEAFFDKTKIELVTALKDENLLLANSDEINKALINYNQLASIYKEYQDVIKILNEKIDEVEKIPIDSQEIKSKKEEASTKILEVGLQKSIDCIDKISTTQAEIVERDNKQTKERLGFFDKVKKNISVPNPTKFAKGISKSICGLIDKVENKVSDISKPIDKFVKEVGNRIQSSNTYNITYNIAQTVVKEFRLSNSLNWKMNIEEQIDELSEKINNYDARLKITDNKIEESKSSIVFVKKAIDEVIETKIPELSFKIDCINASEQTIRDLIKQVEHTKTTLSDNISQLSDVIDKMAEISIFKITDSLNSLEEAFNNKENIPEVRSLINSVKKIKENILIPMDSYQNNATIANLQNLESNKKAIESDRETVDGKRTRLIEKRNDYINTIKSIKADGFSGIIKVPKPQEKTKQIKTKPSLGVAMEY